MVRVCTILCTRLLDPDFRCGFQANLPHGLWLCVDPWISYGQKWGDKAWELAS